MNDRKNKPSNVQDSARRLGVQQRTKSTSVRRNDRFIALLLLGSQKKLNVLLSFLAIPQ
jgi:hypothetical protein